VDNGCVSCPINIICLKYKKHRLASYVVKSETFVSMHDLMNLWVNRRLTIKMNVCTYYDGIAKWASYCIFFQYGKGNIVIWMLWSGD